MNELTLAQNSTPWILIMLIAGPLVLGAIIAIARKRS